jgi:hypothetical protein
MVDIRLAVEETMLWLKLFAQFGITASGAVIYEVSVAESPDAAIPVFIK